MAVTVGRCSPAWAPPQMPITVQIIAQRGRKSIVLQIQLALERTAGANWTWLPPGNGQRGAPKYWNGKRGIRSRWSYSSNLRLIMALGPLSSHGRRIRDPAHGGQYPQDPCAGPLSFVEPWRREKGAQRIVARVACIPVLDKPTVLSSDPEAWFVRFHSKVITAGAIMAHCYSAS